MAAVPGRGAPKAQCRGACGPGCAWQVALLLALSAAVEFEERRQPAFFDYDCELVNTVRATVADWNSLYAWVEETVVQAKTPSYDMPPEFRPLVEGPLAAQAESECPLGVMYLRVLVFYHEVAKGTANAGLMTFASRVQDMLTRYSVYAVALSRWPVFYALEHFSPAHKEQSEWFCEGVKGVLDWGDLRLASKKWAHVKRNKLGTAEELDAMEHYIANMFFTILRHPHNQAAAQDECEFGFYFLVANQVVAAASRETQHLPPFNLILDSMMERAPFARIAASGWPIFTVLAIFSDLNKGIWFFGVASLYCRASMCDIHEAQGQGPQNF